LYSTINQNRKENKMKNLIVMKSVTAGALGTLAMTIFAAMAPLMGMPEMNVPKMLSGAMGLPMVFGWVAHFMVGVVLALLYATVFYNRFKGSRVVKGMKFSLIPWLMAQLIVMPMMAVMNHMSFSSGIFSGSVIMALGSLMGHLVYGLVLGLTYKEISVADSIEHSVSNAKY
jgi:uncharacterized membrane protein YagU involved in acid resistance